MSGTENNSGISPSERYQVGDLVVDVNARHVFRAGQKIHLTELSFDVLVALLRHAPNVVSRQQLMDEVWQQIIVEPDTVKKRITLLRESLDDNTHHEPLVRIVRGRGYTISAPVERLETYDQCSPNTKIDEIMGLRDTSLLAIDGIRNVHNEDIDPLALEAYMEGKLLRWKSGRLTDSIAAFERAIDIDPSFAAAHAELSLALMGGPHIEQQCLKNAEASRKAARRALELDPQLPIAYLATGRVALTLDLDLVNAELLFKKGLSFEPNNRYLLLYPGYIARIRRDFDTAIELAIHYVVNNSSNADAHLNLGQNYYVASRYREAINAYRGALTLDPNLEFSHLCIGRVRALQGDPEEALRHMEQETSPLFRSYGFVIAHAAAGDKSASEKALDEFISEGHQFPYWIGTLHAYRNDIDSAFEAFESAYSMRDNHLLEITVDPLLKGIRNDPRYTELVNRLKFD